MPLNHFLFCLTAYFANMYLCNHYMRITAALGGWEYPPALTQKSQLPAARREYPTALAQKSLLPTARREYPTALVQKLKKQLISVHMQASVHSTLEKLPENSVSLNICITASVCKLFPCCKIIKCPMLVKLRQHCIHPFFIPA